MGVVFPTPHYRDCNAVIGPLCAFDAHPQQLIRAVIGAGCLTATGMEGVESSRVFGRIVSRTVKRGTYPRRLSTSSCRFRGTSELPPRRQAPSSKKSMLNLAPCGLGSIFNPLSKILVSHVIDPIIGPVSRGQPLTAF